MTYTSRLGSVAGRALPGLPPYICLQCRHQATIAARRATPRLQTSSPLRRNASSTPFAQRLRNKIWGTDTPPGQENPYGEPGSFERQRTERLAQRDERPADEEAPEKLAAVEQYQESEFLEGNEMSTWEGMRVIGGPKWGHREWDEMNPFQGYMEKVQAGSRNEIVSVIHRALVEVMTLKKANLALLMRRNPYEATEDYDPTKDYKMYRHRVAQGATFGVSDNGEMTVRLETEDLERTILDCIEPRASSAVEEAAEDYETLDQDQIVEDEEGEGREEMDATDFAEREELDLSTLEEAEILEAAPEEEQQLPTIEEQPSVYTPVDDSWVRLSLADPELKFAVLKRVMQLSGRRISDPDIANIKDAKALLAHLVKKPKPKKLVQTLRANKAVSLPNVELRDRRYTPIDKEKEIGRWKVIEKELKARGLPVTGKGTIAVGHRVA